MITIDRVTPKKTTIRVKRFWVRLYNWGYWSFRMRYPIRWRTICEAERHPDWEANAR